MLRGISLTLLLIIMFAWVPAANSASAILAAASSFSVRSERLLALHRDIVAAMPQSSSRSELDSLARLVRQLFRVQRYDDDYSMQASVHTAYQLLRRAEFAEQDIILMSPDSVSTYRKICNDSWSSRRPETERPRLYAESQYPILTDFASRADISAPAKVLWSRFLTAATNSSSLGCFLLRGHKPHLAHFPKTSFNMRSGRCRGVAKHCGGFLPMLDYSEQAATAGALKAVLSGNKTQAKELCTAVRMRPGFKATSACSARVLSVGTPAFVLVVGRDARDAKEPGVKFHSESLDSSVASLLSMFLGLL